MRVGTRYTIVCFWTLRAYLAYFTQCRNSFVCARSGHAVALITRTSLAFQQNKLTNKNKYHTPTSPGAQHDLCDTYVLRCSTKVEILSPFQKCVVRDVLVISHIGRKYVSSRALPFVSHPKSACFVHVGMVRCVRARVWPLHVVTTLNVTPTTLLAGARFSNTSNLTNVG